jgi:hypothetical protein
MRLEVGTSEFALLRQRGLAARVYVDDVEQQSCTLADEEGGFVRRYKRDGDRFVRDASGECLEEEIVSGRVVIRIVARAALDATPADRLIGRTWLGWQWTKKCIASAVDAASAKFARVFNTR